MYENRQVNPPTAVNLEMFLPQISEASKAGLQASPPRGQDEEAPVTCPEGHCMGWKMLGRCWEDAEIWGHPSYNLVYRPSLHPLYIIIRIINSSYCSSKPSWPSWGAHIVGIYSSGSIVAT